MNLNKISYEKELIAVRKKNHEACNKVDKLKKLLCSKAKTSCCRQKSVQQDKSLKLDRCLTRSRLIKADYMEQLIEREK